MVWGILLITAFVASLALAFISWFMAGAPGSTALFGGIAVVLALIMRWVNAKD